MTTTPPTTTTRPLDASTPIAASSSTNANANAQGPPEFVVTPATPNTPMHPQNSVSQSLPVPADVKENKAGEASASSGGDVTKNGEAKTTGAGVVAAEKKDVPSTAEKNITPTEKPAASTSNPTTSTAARSTNRSAPKKKKRTGLSGFLLRMGCLSANEFEDPEPKKGTAPAKSASIPASTTSAPAATPKTAVAKEVKTPLPVVGDAKPAHQPEVSGATGTTGTTLVETGETEKVPTQPGDEVVVAPKEPTTLPDDETAGLTSSAVQAPGSGSALLATSSSRRQSESSPENEKTDDTSGGYSNISESEIPDESSGAAAAHHEEEYDEEYEDEEDRLIAQGGMGIPVDEHGNPAPLLPVMDKVHSGRKCLVLDLDETLLHSSFKMLPSADYIVPVEIESQTHNVYVIKRPGVDHFLTEMGKIYEVVIFTASLSKYADPVLDMLDTGRVVRHRLFRESCYNHKGNYVKDLSQLGREMEDCIIIDNSPASYIFHPNNAVPVSTWFNDPHDTELTDLCPFLADLATVDDIRGVLDGNI